MPVKVLYGRHFLHTSKSCVCALHASSCIIYWYTSREPAIMTWQQSLCCLHLQFYRTVTIIRDCAKVILALLWAQHACKVGGGSLLFRDSFIGRANQGLLKIWTSLYFILWNHNLGELREDLKSTLWLDFFDLSNQDLSNVCLDFILNTL